MKSEDYSMDGLKFKNKLRLIHLFTYNHEIK